jgi:hypothetical protein
VRIMISFKGSCDFAQLVLVLSDNVTLYIKNDKQLHNDRNYKTVSGARRANQFVAGCISKGPLHSQVGSYTGLAPTDF